MKWLNQLVVEVRNKEGKRITIVGQAETQQQSTNSLANFTCCPDVSIAGCDEQAYRFASANVAPFAKASERLSFSGTGLCANSAYKSLIGRFLGRPLGFPLSHRFHGGRKF